MSQLPDPEQQLTGDDLNLFLAMKKKRGDLKGFYRTIFNSPALAEKVGALGTFLRFEGALNQTAKKFVILANAKNLNVPFVWQQHYDSAIELGVPKPVLESVRLNSAADLKVLGEYQLLYDVTIFASKGQNIPNDLQSQFLESYSVEELVELVTICGFYKMVATINASFDVELPNPESPPF
jgi:4-carboxymuconolactone decarboxylase